MWCRASVHAADTRGMQRPATFVCVHCTTSAEVTHTDTTTTLSYMCMCCCVRSARHCHQLQGACFNKSKVTQAAVQKMCGRRASSMFMFQLGVQTTCSL